MTVTSGLTCLGLLLFLVEGTAEGQSSVDSTLQVVDSLYVSGSYPQAELEARRLLETDLLSDSVRVGAEQWVAFALVAQGRPALAKEHFVNILRRRPSYDLDPLLTSPKILTVFLEARVAFRSAQNPTADPRAARDLSLPDRITFRTILFPGWEQLYHGRKTAGTAFVGAGIATLGTGVVLEFMRSSAHQKYRSATTPADIESKYQTYNSLRTAAMWAFAAFAAVYLASELDVFTYDSPVSFAFQPALPGNPASSLVVLFPLR